MSSFGLANGKGCQYGAWVLFCQDSGYGDNVLSKHFRLTLPSVKSVSPDSHTTIETTRVTFSRLGSVNWGRKRYLLW